MAKVNLIESPYSLLQLKGIGPKKIEVLQQLNIHTVEDLVLYLPTRYEDNTVIDLNQAEDQSNVTIEGQVYTAPVVAFFGRNKSKLTVHLMVNNIAVKCIFFNQPYLKKKIELNQTITVKVSGIGLNRKLLVIGFSLIHKVHKLKKTQIFN